MAISMPKGIKYQTGNILMYLFFLFSAMVWGLVFEIPGENNLLPRENGFDLMLRDDSLSTNFFLASAPQDDSLDSFAPDGCTFTLEGCPPIMEDPSPVALGFGLSDGNDKVGCDETLGDCTSLFDEWPTTANIDNLALPVDYDNYIASGGSAVEALDAKDREPKIYYDCAPDYTSCIIHDRSRGSDFQIKAIVHCPSDVAFDGNILAGGSSKFRGSGLFGLPGSRCEFCYEDGSLCEVLDCDIATIPSKNNNWGQPWGTCREPSCSCTKSIQALNIFDATPEFAASSDSLVWLFWMPSEPCLGVLGKM